MAQLNWIISAFNLTSAAFIPFWGQVADIFGREYSIQSSIVIMMIGSALCTGASTNAFAVLLLGRALQGVGCAGLNVIVRVILADKVSLEENAKSELPWITYISPSDDLAVEKLYSSIPGVEGKQHRTKTGLVLTCR